MVLSALQVPRWWYRSIRALVVAPAAPWALMTTVTHVSPTLTALNTTNTTTQRSAGGSSQGRSKALTSQLYGHNVAKNAQTRSYAGPGWVMVTIDELRTVYVGAAIRQRAYGRSLYSHCPFINDKGCWALFDEFHAHDGCRRSHERPPGGSRR